VCVCVCVRACMCVVWMVIRDSGYSECPFALFVGGLTNDL